VVLSESPLSQRAAEESLPLRDAFSVLFFVSTVSASLAQIGEFSFILAGLGVALGVLPAQGQKAEFLLDFLRCHEST
jgi:CPA2 family monovalent cation:H+ antiporter-2